MAHTALKSSETRTGLQAKIEGVEVPQIPAINRLRSLGVPERLIAAVTSARSQRACNSATDAIVAWSREAWELSEEDTLLVLNGEKQLEPAAAVS